MKFDRLFNLTICLFVLASINSHADSTTIEPIFNKSAQIYSGLTIDSEIFYYNDRDLEEIESFDAYEVLFNATLPITKNMQVRLILPAYTDGSGKLKKTGSALDGKPIDVDGNGCIYEFTSLQLEYQLVSHIERGYNALIYGGYGGRAAYLDTTYGDKLNHKGELAKIGLRYDQAMPDYDSNLFSTIEYRHYWDTDDINPANDEGTSFDIINMTGSWVWNQSSAFHPVVEVRYSTDINNYNALSLVPEFIYNVNSIIDVKMAAPIGISSDADKYGARLMLTTHF